MKAYRLNPSKDIQQLLKVWWIASRPHALSVSIVTVGTAAALAASVVTVLKWEMILFSWLFATFIQIGTHFINDALDFEKGVDTIERLGFTKVTSMGLVDPRFMLTSGFFCLALAFLFGIPLIAQGGWPLILILLICIVNAYIYTGGPFSLSYTGLGDLFAFLFFGPIGISVVYYLQTGYVDLACLLAGSQIGLLAASMTALNNLRDIKTDAQAGKRTLAVRYGQTFARCEVTGLLIAPFLIGFIWLLLDYPWAAFLPLLMAPLACLIIKGIWLVEPCARYNLYFIQAMLLQLSFSFFLSLGCLWI
jgi:1,4-dihydroxy-2-naphthoate octaprenyltransferase